MNKTMHTLLYIALIVFCFGMVYGVALSLRVQTIRRGGAFR